MASPSPTTHAAQAHVNNRGVPSSRIWPQVYCIACMQYVRNLTQVCHPVGPGPSKNLLPFTRWLALSACVKLFGCRSCMLLCCQTVLCPKLQEHEGTWPCMRAPS